MPFSAEVKARMFVRSARICALCYKQCGTNIEAAHIIAEADGGSNDDDNGIPLCFDCHQEIGAYDKRHPKGNKFSEFELKARRDQLYSLVENGSIQAQIIAQRLRRSAPEELRRESPAEVAKFIAQPYSPSREARAVLEQAKTQWGAFESFAPKLQLLESRDRAYVVDQLIDAFEQEQALKALLAVIGSPQFQAESAVLMEQLLRRVTLTGSVEAKARLMRSAPLHVLESSDEGLRAAFFQDIIDIMLRDQYQEVNKITPASIRLHSAIPSQLHRAYMEALLSQADSAAYDGAPAAQASLRNLPEVLARAGLESITKRDLMKMRSNSDHDPLRDFVGRYRHYWTPEQEELFDDFVQLDYFAFVQKHWHDDDS